MKTTKEQRAAACAIIEKFTAEDVTFPADFVLALLSDADERDRLAERVRELEEENYRVKQANTWTVDMNVQLNERAETAEAKLAVAVEALELVMQHGRIDNSEHRLNMVASAIAKIKGAP